MTESVIKITGIPQKPPQMTANKDAVLLFRMQQETDNSQAVSYFRVTVRRSIWKRVSKDITHTTYYVIEGVPKASVTSKGAPFVSVFCSSMHVINGLVEDANSPGHFTFPGSIPEDTDEVIPLSSISLPDNLDKPTSGISRAMSHFQKHKAFRSPLRVKKDTMTLVSGYPEYFVAKDLNIQTVPVSYNLLTGAPAKDEIKLKHITWYTPEEIKEINVSDITLTEDIHLNVQNFVFKINLKELSKTRNISVPIAVRAIDQGKYALVTGAARYYAAKILDIQKIPAVITDMGHDEFVKERFLQHNPVEDEKPKKERERGARTSIDGETPIDLITIPEAFARTRPNPAKILDTITYYKTHGKFDKPVVLRGDSNLLIDGYKRYIAAQEMGLESVWTRKLM
jgi:hypothetical protein